MTRHAVNLVIEWSGRSCVLLHQTYVGETFAPVETQGLETPVAQHLDDLCVFLTILLERQLSALIVIFLCTTPAILATLLRAS